MNPDKFFPIANFLALIPWTLLAFAPRWHWTELILKNYIFSSILCALYFYFILRSFGKAKGGFGSLDGLSSLFRNKNALLAGWIHYLAFDLFVGTWIWRDSLSLGISHFLMLPVYFLTLMFGPVGLLVYLGFKSFL